MLQHYFKVALRNLTRNKVFSFINILGLAVGMGVCLLIYQYIHFELSFDDFHENGEGTYRIVQSYTQYGNDEGSDVETTYLTGPVAKNEIPEIADFVRVHSQYGVTVIANTETGVPFEEEEILYTDSNFLEMFNFPLKSGNPSSVFKDKYSIVISERTAIKHFGNEDPIGKVLNVNGGWAIADFSVTGVLAELPGNSHLQFDVLMPMSILLEDEQYTGDGGEDWTNFVTYVKLTDFSDRIAVEKKIAQSITTLRSEPLISGNYEVEVSLQPLDEIHLGSSEIGDPITKNVGDLDNIKTYSIIAIFILLVAWVNYINLSSARSMQRATEVGIRKSIGAFRRQVISQFLVEAALTNGLSMILGFGIAYMLLPFLNELMGLSLILDVATQYQFWIIVALTLIIGTVLSGAYPAFILSSFNAVGMFMRGPVKRKGFSLRKGLVVFQFVTSILLIAGTYLIYNQVSHMKNAENNMDMDQVLVVRGPRVGIDWDQMQPKLETFYNKLKSHHSILKTTGSGSIPGKGFDWRTGIHRVGQSEEEAESTSIVFVDHYFTDTYQLELLAGSPFLEEGSFRSGVLINEAALNAYDIKSADDAIEEKLVLNGDTLKILGVVKNYPWASLKEKHEPFILGLYGSAMTYFSLRINPANIQKTLAHVEQVYRQIFPGNPYSYFFLDESFNRQYQADLRFGNLFAAFSGLAIFIACLGLFALVSFSATLRMKEIGIRKVLGAGIGHLMGLLSKEYMILLLIANVVSVPITYYIGSSWLDNYAFRTELSIEFFLIPGIILLAISLLTVSYQTFATAKANPVDALRSE
ncbi:ABC transporter permease [Reichenbachiella sp.]|uniref:ABC transporter permease n=1 Tax=Reichenbachiella sp. TaxID=2184521 RepID=UPI0032987FF2